ncbi:hypothetical protein N0V90_011931 [Kalmusia sp. IMI 367209]|nr:hypothetical protein N0V90_011931 [Kalmusia sp. IMI 367209]
MSPPRFSHERILASVNMHHLISYDTIELLELLEMAELVESPEPTMLLETRELLGTVLLLSSEDSEKLLGAVEPAIWTPNDVVAAPELLGEAVTELLDTIVSEMELLDDATTVLEEVAEELTDDVANKNHWKLAKQRVLLETTAELLGETELLSAAATFGAVLELLDEVSIALMLESDTGRDVLVPTVEEKIELDEDEEMIPVQVPKAD